jgi:hypothetical protein
MKKAAEEMSAGTVTLPLKLPAAEQWHRWHGFDIGAEVAEHSFRVIPR